MPSKQPKPRREASVADLIKLQERTPSSKLRYWAKTQGDFVCPPSELLEQAADLLDECLHHMGTTPSNLADFYAERTELLARLRGETKGER